MLFRSRHSRRAINEYEGQIAGFQTRRLIPHCAGLSIFIDYARLDLHAHFDNERAGLAFEISVNCSRMREPG